MTDLARKDAFTQEDLRLMFYGYINGSFATYQGAAVYLDIDITMISKIIHGEREVPANVAKRLFKLDKYIMYTKA